jgi:cytoskeleton-associated protein 5
MRPDEVQQLEADLGPLASPALRANLFAKDFKKHCLAADSLRAALEAPEQGAGDVLPAAVSSLDLLLKWSVVRLSEGNTATLISVLSMLKVGQGS